MYNEQIHGSTIKNVLPVRDSNPKRHKAIKNHKHTIQELGLIIIIE